MKRVALLVALLAACKQSYREGVQEMCDAPSHVTAANQGEKATGIAKWIDEHVTNDELRHDMTAMAAVQDKAVAFDLMLKRAGIARTDCAVAAWIVPTSPPTRTP